MGSIFIIQGILIYIYAFDHNPPHIHVKSGDGEFTITTAETIESIEILNLMGQIVGVSSDANINVSLSAGTYFVRVITAEGNSYIEKMVVK